MRFPVVMVMACGGLFDTYYHFYYHFSPGVPLFQIPDRRRDLPQLVTPVDDRCQLSGLHELTQNGQVLLVQLRLGAPTKTKMPLGLRTRRYSNSG